VAVFVVNKRRGLKWIAETYPGAPVIDVTSRGPEPWVRLSPFFAHDGIPIPFTPGAVGASVEGIWQALKVFEHADVDSAKLTVTSMTGLKRTVRRFGPVLGHRCGLHGDRLLDYVEARWQIYLPTYRWVLDGPAHPVTERLRLISQERDLVLLDYTTNGDPADPTSPLSHAALVAAYLSDQWPAEPSDLDLKGRLAVDPDARSSPGGAP
jgi:hypothetical protein